MSKFHIIAFMFFAFVSNACAVTSSSELYGGGEDKPQVVGLNTVGRRNDIIDFQYEMIERDGQFFTEDLVIDSDFSHNHVVQIFRAIDMWRVATGGMFNPVIRIDDVPSDGVPFQMSSVKVTDPVIVQLFNNINEGRDPTLTRLGVWGWVTADRKIFILEDEVSTPELPETIFQELILHELGHYIGLIHSPNVDNLMFPGIGDLSPCITYENISSFCNVWQGCNFQVAQEICIWDYENP